MKHRLSILSFAVMILALVPQVGAHHGGAAHDQSQTVTFKGTVTELRFINPHVLLYWDVTKDGTTEKWSGWLTAPTKLSRAGWSKTTLKPGDQIEVSGSPHRAGNHVLQIKQLVGPGGKALPLFEN